MRPGLPLPGVGTSSWKPWPRPRCPGGGAHGAAAAVAACARAAPVRPPPPPVGATLSLLVAAGGRLLVLVADVGRVRPLLTRDAWLPRVGWYLLYLNGACAVSRLGLAVRGDGARDGTDAVMTDTVLAAARPSGRRFDHVAFVDPPFDGGRRQILARWPRRPASTSCGRALRQA